LKLGLPPEQKAKVEEWLSQLPPLAGRCFPQEKMG
jgi:hypothetical protein